MNDSTKPVFISYASQDAAVARRVAEALRTAGVEVWFDQHELRGGDDWDAKIRRQIKECSLFVPIISEETNARPEGYFRLEWKLAVDRSHLMADDHSFLFPIIIGHVTEGSARVPERFRDLQWTRLRLDETPSELATRVAKILTPGYNDLESPQMHRERGRSSRPQRTFAGKWWWLIFPVFGMLMAVVPMWRVLTPEKRSSRQPKPRPTAIAPAVPFVAKQQLITDVWPLIESGSRAELRAADQLCKRAVENDPNDAEAWAAWSQAETQLIARDFDRTAARRAGAQDKATRALQLDPKSYEARLAQACLWTSGVGDAANPPPAETESWLRALVQEKPDDTRATKALLALTVGSPAK